MANQRDLLDPTGNVQLMRYVPFLGLAATSGELWVHGLGSAWLRGFDGRPCTTGHLRKVPACRGAARRMGVRRG
jgi:hypothetical protein